MSTNAEKRRPAYYYGYLRSADWLRVRTEKLNEENWRCEQCRVRRATIVHHLSYDNLGHEPPEDLMAVCHQCHDLLHSWPQPANDNRQLNLPFANDDADAFSIVDDLRSNKRRILP